MGTVLSRFLYTMVLSVKSLLTPHAVFKMVELVLAIVSFLLARVGYAGYTPTFGPSLDQVWLGYLTVGGWLIILPAILIGLLLGDQVAWRIDSLLSIVGACLYLASGSCAISYYSSIINNKMRETGLVMVADAVMVVMVYGRKGRAIAK